MNPAIARMLHLVFVTIRSTAYEGQPSIAFHLADLFHNFPMVLAREGEQAALSQLFEDAQRKQLDAWLAKWIRDNKIRITAPRDARPTRRRRERGD